MGTKTERVKNLFFSPEFQADFLWDGSHRFRIASILPKNKKQISDGLKEMSSASIRNRFLGSKKEFSDKELEYLTALDGWNHYALGIEEGSGKSRGIAIIRLVRSSEFHQEAEVAITIIDEYQGKGMGTFLINLIILAALERGITRLSFTFLPQNLAIQKLIRKAGAPLSGPHTHDYVQLYLDLKHQNPKELKDRLKTTLPKIEDYP
jgi:RimJ/RimL family protein N-acetyltransferase